MQFQLVYLNDKGKRIQEILEADSLKAARALLRNRKLSVQELQPLDKSLPESEKKTGAKRKRAREVRGKKQDAMVMCLRQLSAMLKSGMPLLQSLDFLIQQTEHKGLALVLRQIKTDVQGGLSLSASFDRHPRWFEPLVLNLTEAGEASGNLDTCLGYAAEAMNKRKVLQSKLVAAITYPCLMLMLGTLVVIFLMAKVIPQITEILLDQEKALPWPTQLLVAISDFIREGYFIWGTILAVLIFSWWRIRDTETWQRFTETCILKTPLLGDLYRKQAVARFALTFRAVLSAGSTVVESLRMAGKALGVQRFREQIEIVENRIVEGDDLGKALKRADFLPLSAAGMITIGEQSASLEEVLENIYLDYSQEVDLKAQQLTEILNPLLIIFLGGTVGFIVAAVMLPILEIGG